MLTSSIDSLCTAGSYKHAYVEQPLDLQWLAFGSCGIEEKGADVKRDMGCVDPALCLLGAPWGLGALKR